MQSIQQEKIKKLIQASPLLNTAERQEWTMLLEVMDDKQASELEKILLAGSDKFKNLGVPEKKVQSHVALGHIMNLPSGLDEPGNTPAVPPVLPPQAKPAFSAAAQVPPVQQKPVSAPANKGFLSRLKNVLMEKELPTTKQEYQLELEAPKELVVTVKPAVVIQPPKEVKKPVEPVMPQPPKTIPTQPKPAVPVQPQVKLPEKPKPPLPPKFTPAPFKPEVKPAFKPLSVQPTNSPRALYSKVLATQHEGDSGLVPPVPSPQKKGEGQKVSSVKVAIPAGTFKGKIDTPEDMGQLTVTVFNQSDFEQLTESIRQVVKKFGYHQVLFSLEKSPLFQMYINTGLKLLSEEKSFEKMESEASSLSERYLSRKEFEGVADLLRQIQLG